MKIFLTAAIMVIAAAQTTWAQPAQQEPCLYQSTSLVCESSVSYRNGRSEAIDAQLGPMEEYQLADGSKACQAMVTLKTVNGKFVAVLRDSMKIFAQQISPTGRKVIFDQVMRYGRVTQVLGNRNPDSHINSVNYTCYLTR